MTTPTPVLGQNHDQAYTALIESLVRSENSNDEWYRKQHPDYYKSAENFKAYNDYKAQKYRDALQVRIEIQETYCKKDKKFCWSETDLAFHQKEVENKIKSDQIYAENFLAGGQNAADVAVGAFHQDANKEACEEYNQNCGVGEQKEEIKIEPMPMKVINKIPVQIVQPEIIGTIAVVVEPIVKKINEKDYLANTCQWVPDMPRRLVFGPGCMGDDCLCVGLVMCDQKSGGKFIRQSTCSRQYCTDKKAVACTKDPLFGSVKPKNETKVTVTEEIQKVLTPSTNKD